MLTREEFANTAWKMSYEEYHKCYCPECDKKEGCIHRDALRRVPKIDGGLGLCPRLDEDTDTEEEKNMEELKNTKNETVAENTKNKKKGVKIMKNQENTKNNDEKTIAKPTYNDNVATIIIPTIMNEKEGFSVRFTEKQGKNIVIPTKCTNKNAFVLDVQHHALKMMLDSAEKKVTKLSAKKQESDQNPEKTFSEKDATTLKQNIALVEMCKTQLKKYTLKKVDGKLVTDLPAKMAAAILTNTPLSVDCQTVAVYVKIAYNTTIGALDGLYDGDNIVLSKEEQESITQVKNTIKEAFHTYCAPVSDRMDDFNLSISNRDVAKIVFSVYDGFRRDDKTGNITDGLKLDNKNEKRLASILTAYVYGRMSGSKF